MRKVISVLTAGALLLASTGAAMAAVVQGNYGTVTVVSSTASSSTGSNSQFGGGFQLTNTGNALSVSDVTSVANQNGTGFSFGFTKQTNAGTVTQVGSAASASTGSNTQVGFGHSAKITNTGDAGSSSTVSAWANINLKGFSMSF